MRRRPVPKLFLAVALAAANACAGQHFSSPARRVMLPAPRPGAEGLPPGLTFPSNVEHARSSVRDWTRTAIIVALTGGRWLQACDEPDCPRIHAADSTRTSLPKTSKPM